jgi:hypothetical protein
LSRKDWSEEGSEDDLPAIDSGKQGPAATDQEEFTMITQAISTVQPTWTRELTNIYPEDQQLQQLIQQFQQGELDPVKYQYHQGLIFYKGRIHLGNLKTFQQQVLQQFHSHPLAGHIGAHKTSSRLKKEFYWPAGLVCDMRSEDSLGNVRCASAIRQKMPTLQGCFSHCQYQNKIGQR